MYLDSFHRRDDGVLQCLAYVKFGFGRGDLILVAGRSRLKKVRALLQYISRFNTPTLLNK